MGMSRRQTVSSVYIVALMIALIQVRAASRLQQYVGKMDLAAAFNEPSEKHFNMTAKASGDPTDPTHARWHRGDAEYLPFAGLTESKMLDRHCCRNGGTCILGSFCACPKFFTGRYCEYDMQASDCGTVAHGDWLESYCTLCRCVYGVMHCFTLSFRTECDHKTKYEMTLPAHSSFKLQPVRGYWILALLFIAVHCWITVN
ncbi:protein Cripto isoform X2 [Microcaecilia unicolor]|uniref:Teratocarcinoma-derived growth factor 1 isoform X2 n=2 Tax=Microcaecilia unicolor TaxID=1415580 RepID=A0A6P7X6Y1_9AMPH|nr:teratocarcinoma-derived growth factor 1 isoform X2 [Microcaecilia unicolor]